MAKVKKLDKITADKIAAGEVVERPASVVKELIENSIDAQSRSIQINLEDGGRKSIEIIDDGIGMSPDDAMLSLERFATSKITNWEELEGLNTFGFRGEALPSIAAVSKMEILTREELYPVGVRIKCDGGVIGDPEPAGTPKGTRIIVKDLFYNTPARQKFLKSASAETAHISGITQKLSLVNEDIGFRLTSNGRKLIDFPSQMNIKERILKIWGLPLDYNAIHIEHETPSVRVSGYICMPDKHKSNRTYQLIFVNGRFIKSSMINQAIQEGFAPLLPAGKFAMALVFIDLMGTELDINVHPNKMEVRFIRPGTIFKAVRDAIKTQLRSFGYSPVIPGVTPPIDNYTPAANITFYGSGVSKVIQEPAAPLPGRKFYEEVIQIPVISEPAPVSENPDRTELSFFPPDSHSPDNPNEQTQRKRVKFNALAQVQKTYIVGKMGEEIWLIDQHTAHERINFEKLARIGKDLSHSQKLLFPIVIELPPTLFNFLQDKKEEFEALGFEIEPFGGFSYSIKAVPYGFKNLDKEKYILEILEEVAEGEPYRNLEAFFEHLRASIACKASVKAGDQLTVEEMNALMNEFISMDYSSYCPHGRPVVIKLSKEHLDRMFHRI